MGTTSNIEKSSCYSHSMSPLYFLIKGWKGISHNQKKKDPKGSAAW